jgi:MFS transporter, DHA2 family, multidrug resistance protein
MWQMTQFSLYMGMEPVILSGLVQGFGLGCTFVPLNTIALSNLARHILTQGTALRSLMRNLGGSVGIWILEARLIENIQTRLGQPDGISPSRMAEMLEVDKAGPKVRC